MNIGEKIKALRIEHGYTQEEIADYVQTTKQTIHKYETSIITNIPASKIKLLSEKLQTTPAYLMGWEENSAEHFGIESAPSFGALTPPEQTHIKKYRTLDERGKDMVDTVLDKEVERAKNKHKES